MTEISNDKLDDLFATGQNAAEHLLAENAEFYPIGHIIGSDGEIRMVAVDIGQENPESQIVIDQFEAIFLEQAKAGAILASAVSYDARIQDPQSGEPTDAVITKIRAHGYARNVIVPYEIKTSGIIKKKRELKFGQTLAMEDQNEIFT
ncbi:MAG: hypothetical protein AAGE37_10580 [Pseudomonadota bacterium]